MPYAYLLWLVFFVFLPLAILWLWQCKLLVPYKRVIILSVLGSLLVAVPWDILAIKERIWYFTEPQIVGIWFLGLPLEEWLFISSATAGLASLTVLFWEKWGRKM